MNEHTGGVPEVLVLGRVGVDVYPLQTGVSLADVTTFGKFLGGSAGNVAVAVARHGRRVALVSGVGDDPFGVFLRRRLGEFGVDAQYVREVPGHPTPVTFCEMFPPDDFPLYFYGRDSAPDLELPPLDVELVRRADVLWATVTGLCREPSRTVTLDALAARARRGLSVLDLDWRPAFWRSPQAAGPVIRKALAHVSVAIGNLDECEVAVGERDPRRAAVALREHGVRTAIVKQGPAGVLGLDDDGYVEVAPHPVQVVNGLGAGDAFGGALCHALLAGRELSDALRFANVAGALVAAQLACSDAMPSTAQVQAALAGSCS
ncbi:MAG: 5-dehydro-2-deoxygluconokinase [Sporichthyaceae bacterium]